ncbi:MAG: hypothetical protein AB7E55_28245, partial [Pigmentiphaga sp.]
QMIQNIRLRMFDAADNTQVKLKFNTPTENVRIRQITFYRPLKASDLPTSYTIKPIEPSQGTSDEPFRQRVQIAYDVQLPRM